MIETPQEFPKCWNFFLEKKTNKYKAKIPHNLFVLKHIFYQTTTHTLERFRIYQMFVNKINIINHFDESKANERDVKLMCLFRVAMWFISFEWLFFRSLQPKTTLLETT